MYEVNEYVARSVYTVLINIFLACAYTPIHTHLQHRDNTRALSSTGKPGVNVYVSRTTQRSATRIASFSYANKYPRYYPIPLVVRPWTSRNISASEIEKKSALYGKQSRSLRQLVRLRINNSVKITTVHLIPMLAPCKRICLVCKNTGRNLEYKTKDM